MGGYFRRPLSVWLEFGGWSDEASGLVLASLGASVVMLCLICFASVDKKKQRNTCQVILAYVYWCF